MQVHCIADIYAQSMFCSSEIANSRRTSLVKNKDTQQMFSLIFFSSTINAVSGESGKLLNMNCLVWRPNIQPKWNKLQTTSVRIYLQYSVCNNNNNHPLFSNNFFS